ncbi:MAG: VWA domain-containing protein [Promethearchaeota archaeon]|nr:MAG: VWA domain-containing protein [Candidatus Lokiarchaeota archaeon]
MNEDIYFYLDLTKDMIKKKELIKSIKYYIEEKNKVNIKGRYSLLIFQEEGNPIFINDKKDSDIITKSIEENWKGRPKEQSYFENGLFYIFSYIAETVRRKAKYNRIIIITDTPSDLSEDYQVALFNLVSKIKNFPTFIDIIRVSSMDERFFSDDVKLNMLASDTKGGIFYIKDRKEFSDVIKKLVKTKQFLTTFIDKPDLIKISKEDYFFYSHLAKSLKKTKNVEGLVCHFCHEEVCPICTDIYDVPLVCEDCNSGFHKCCVTNYVINNNIGIPNIFRCPNKDCDVLLKIDEDEIIEVSGEVEVSTVKEYLDEEITEKFHKELPKVKPLPISASNREAEKSEKSESLTISSEGEPIKTIRIGGFFGKAYTVKKVGDKIVYERVTQTAFKPNSGTNLPGNSTSRKSFSSINERERKKPTFIICQQCGTQNDFQQLKCSNCGFKL